MANVDPHLIAARLRGLFAWPDSKRLTELAQELHVSEDVLALAIAQRSPRQTPALLTAVVRRYAVDPTWLMTGAYDSDRHRAALGDGERSPEEAIAELMRDPDHRSDPPRT